MVEIVFPSSLYRYRRTGAYFHEELRRAINGQQVYLPLASSVNDPFDLSPIAIESPIPEILKDLRTRHQNRRLIDRKRYEELVGLPVDRRSWRAQTRELRPSVKAAKEENRVALKTLGELRSKSRVACFSETNESAPMWAHYAGHDGICLQYDFVRRPSELLEFYPLPVRYADDRPTLSTMDLRAFTDRSSAQRRLKSDERKKVFDALFLTKDSSWSYEKEWRIIDTAKNPARYDKVESLSVTAVYFGIDADMERVGGVIEEFQDSVLLFKARVHPKRYGFQFERLN